MADERSFRLHDSDRLGSAAVFSSPHSGRRYPEAFLAATRLGALALRASEDAFVDELFAAAPACGAPLLAASAPRAYLDLNRSPDDLDPAVIDGAPRGAANPRVAAGLGVIPRVVAENAAIYDRPLTLAEAQARIARIHAPYHAELRRLMTRASAAFGCAVLFDCHSMPGDALRVAPRVAGRRPEVILGDRFGVSAARWVTDLAQRAFEDAGFVVARNAPFAGGFITQTYGRPKSGWHAVQIEIDRSLYLDERKVRPSPRFDAVRSAVAAVVEDLARAAAPRLPLAAE